MSRTKLNEKDGVMVPWVLRVPAAMKQQLAEMARAEGRDACSFVRWILVKFLKQQEKKKGRG
jgi:predicted DNA-binding protein